MVGLVGTPVLQPYWLYSASAEQSANTLEASSFLLKHQHGCTLLHAAIMSRTTFMRKLADVILAILAVIGWIIYLGTIPLALVGRDVAYNVKHSTMGFFGAYFVFIQALPEVYIPCALAMIYWMWRWLRKS
jgi:hypothetical protein